MNETNENSIVRFNDGNLELEVRISPDEDTVWLTRQQIAELFDRDIKTIGKHINNVFKEEELDKETSVANFATQVLKRDSRTGTEYYSDIEIEYYNLDMIISVGYRVKSQRGVQFRKWANKILKNYMIKGYAINQNRFDFSVLENALKLLDNAKLDGNFLLDAEQMLGFLKRYAKALRLLDEFDHRTIEKPIGSNDVYVLTYEECKEIIELSSFKDTSEHFAMEKDGSFQSSINAIYQTFGGEDVYSTLEEKAANLLYLITKNHSFIDGNKRIAAIVFLYFLEKNNVLFKNRSKIIDDDTLVTLTILIASSNPIDKEIIINLIMTFLVK